MAVELHLVVYDEEEAIAKGDHGAVGYTFAGMTGAMRTTLMSYLRATLEKLEQHERDHPEEDHHGVDEVRTGRRDPGERDRAEDGRVELHREGPHGAGRGELAGGPVASGLILPPGVRL